MRVYQPGSHLLEGGGDRARDWSWPRTRRRLSTLAALVAPYKRRAVFSTMSLLAATATALAPPYLAKYALDEGILEDLGRGSAKLEEWVASSPLAEVEFR